MSGTLIRRAVNSFSAVVLTRSSLDILVHNTRCRTFPLLFTCAYTTKSSHLTLHNVRKELFTYNVSRQLLLSLRYESSKILGRINSRRNQRWRSVQSDGVTNNRDSKAIKLRETKRKVTAKMKELKENIWTIPNALCLTRMAATPFLGYLVLQEYYITSLGIFLFAGATDVIDGYIARTFPGQKSMIGSFLDPAADKFLVATLFLTLTVNGLIPIPLTAIIISRDVCLMAAGFYIRYVSLPPPRTIWRYFDATHATATLSPTAISKVNTGVQVCTIACSLAAPIFGYVDHYALQFLWYITGISTVVSAGSYIYYKNTFTLAAFASKMKKISKES